MKWCALIQKRRLGTKEDYKQEQQGAEFIRQYKLEDTVRRKAAGIARNGKCCALRRTKMLATKGYRIIKTSVAGEKQKVATEYNVERAIQIRGHGKKESSRNSKEKLILQGNEMWSALT